MSEGHVSAREIEAHRALVLHDQPLVVDLIATVPGQGYRLIPTFSNLGWDSGPPTRPEPRH